MSEDEIYKHGSKNKSSLYQNVVQIYRNNSNLDHVFEQYLSTQAFMKYAEKELLLSIELCFTHWSKALNFENTMQYWIQLLQSCGFRVHHCSDHCLRINWKHATFGDALQCKIAQEIAESQMIATVIDKLPDFTEEDFIQAACDNHLYVRTYFSPPLPSIPKNLGNALAFKYKIWLDHGFDLDITNNWINIRAFV